MPDPGRDIFFLDPIQLDAVKEAANIGAGHAASLLSEMTSMEVQVDAPTLKLAPIEQVFGTMVQPGEKVAGFLITVLGDITGRIVFVIPQAETRQFMEAKTGHPLEKFVDLDTMDESLFHQASDLLAGAYLKALSELLGLMVIPNLAGVKVTNAASIINEFALDQGGGKKYVFCIANQFKFVEQQAVLRGYFLFLPDQESLPVIVKAMFGRL